jgi:hypothetical protein
MFAGVDGACPSGANFRCSPLDWAEKASQGQALYQTLITNTNIIGRWSKCKRKKVTPFNIIDAATSALWELLHKNIDGPNVIKLFTSVI